MGTRPARWRSLGAAPLRLPGSRLKRRYPRAMNMIRAYERTTLSYLHATLLSYGILLSLSTQPYSMWVVHTRSQPSQRARLE